MSLARRCAWLLFAAGLGIGTLSDQRVIDLPQRLDGAWILRVDFHVHSFFGDGGLPPWDLRREAERRGLDAIVITNHNRIGASRFAAWLGSRTVGPLMLAGQEITAPRYHVATAGTSRDVDWRQPLSAVLNDVHAQGGIAIAAHPAAPGVGAFDDDEVLQRLDGIEGPLPSFRPEDERSLRVIALFKRAETAHPRFAVIGASDFHFLAPLGAYRTYLLAREPTSAGILDAVREGRTVACDSRGRAGGDEALLRAVAVDCAAVGAGAYSPGPWSRAAFICTWVALLALVLLTGPARES